MRLTLVLLVAVSMVGCGAPGSDEQGTRTITEGGTEELYPFEVGYPTSEASEA